MVWYMKNRDLGVRIIILLSLAGSFCVLTWLVINGNLHYLESASYSSLSRFITPAATSVMIIITNSASYAGITFVAAVLLSLPVTRRPFGVPVAVNAVISAVFTEILKNIIARERPGILWLVTESGYGYPSGHTTNGTALCIIILLTVFRKTDSKKIKIPVLILTVAMPILIGISRVYLGVHNAGDVLGGWVLGVIFALLTDTSFQYTT